MFANEQGSQLLIILISGFVTCVTKGNCIVVEWVFKPSRKKKPNKIKQTGKPHKEDKRRLTRKINCPCVLEGRL